VHGLSVVRLIKPVLVCLHLLTPLLLAFALYPVSTRGAAAVVWGVSVCYYEILKHWPPAINIITSLMSHP